jgi:hypothetical protein
MPVNLGFSAFLLALLSIEQSVMTKTPVGNWELTYWAKTKMKWFLHFCSLHFSIHLLGGIFCSKILWFYRLSVYLFCKLANVHHLPWPPYHIPYWKSIALYSALSLNAASECYICPKSSVFLLHLSLTFIKLIALTYNDLSLVISYCPECNSFFVFILISLTPWGRLQVLGCSKTKENNFNSKLVEQGYSQLNMHVWKCHYKPLICTIDMD